MLSRTSKSAFLRTSTGVQCPALAGWLVSLSSSASQWSSATSSDSGASKCSVSSSAALLPQQSFRIRFGSVQDALLASGLCFARDDVLCRRYAT